MPANDDSDGIGMKTKKITLNLEKIQSYGPLSLKNQVILYS
jgi:hypothetical protein